MRMILTLLILTCFQQLPAQPGADSQFFTGVQLINITNGEKARQPMIQLHEEESISLAYRLLFSADIILMKNTIPYSQYNGKVLEFVQVNAPVHFDYKLSQSLLLEGGIFLGAIARSSNVYITEFVQVKHFETLQAFWDVGLMGGVSFVLKKLGKVSLRYNHGLFPSVPISENEIEKNRMVAIGVTTVF